MNDRLKILYDANVISFEAADYSNIVLEYLKKQGYSEEKTEVLITHIAMATQRVIDKSEVMPFNDEIWQQIIENENYNRAIETFNKIKESCPVVYPIDEERFIIMHLCNVYQN